MKSALANSSFPVTKRIGPPYVALLHYAIKQLQVDFENSYVLNQDAK
jgi:hypothetical protein